MRTFRTAAIGGTINTLIVNNTVRAHVRDHSTLLSGVNLDEWGADDSYAEKVQIKIYGDKDGKNEDGSDKFKEQLVQLASDSNVTEATFDTSLLGSTFWGITLQTISGATTAKVKKATLIKADDSEVALTVSKAWGCEVSTEEAPSGINSISVMSDRGDGHIYNLAGQRVANPTKGIYIKNGKKFIIK